MSRQSRIILSAELYLNYNLRCQKISIRYVHMIHILLNKIKKIQKLKKNPGKQTPCHSSFSTEIFAAHIGDHLRFDIISGPIWGSFPVWGPFAVGNHLRRCTQRILLSRRIAPFRTISVANSLRKQRKKFNTPRT